MPSAQKPNPDWQPRARGKNEAMPRDINLFALPVYVPPKPEHVRPGAEDAFKIQSRGLG